MVFLCNTVQQAVHSLFLGSCRSCYDGATRRLTTFEIPNAASAKSTFK
ncbi:hypothetical protein EPIB2_179 [Tritonibacter mobilis]|nr:hypothetical protein EPIB2_179 [Tritonibacter mobilis]